MNYPRILVVSNNSFSNTDSNGRTLGNLFIGWPKEKLAQFCISTDGPNFDICNNYYCITDKDALDAFIHFRKAQGKRLEPTNKQIVIGSRGEGKKTLLMMLVRNMVWGKRRWKSKSFIEWVQAFKPEIILHLFSDSAFMINIATSLSIELNIPMVLFNTEGFYFFKSNYFRTKTIIDGVLFPINQSIFKKQVRRMMKRVKYTFYLNELLQTDYEREFGGPSMVLYTLSSLEHEDHVLNCEKPVFSYIGNLSHNRPKALMEVADVINSINPHYKLEIYGKPLTKEDENALKSHPSITFKGFIDYNEVKNVIRNSDVLIHAETREKKYEESLKYGFSTKIADSISSGACFVLYAPSEIACSRYVKETGAGWFADNKTDLRNAIEEILVNEDKRKEVLNKAQQVAVRNHSQNSNCQAFMNIILTCVDAHSERNTLL